MDRGSAAVAGDLGVGGLAMGRFGVDTIKLKSARREPDLSLSGLDPVPLSKIGTRLLGRKGKNGTKELSCLLQKCRFLSRTVSHHSYCKSPLGRNWHTELPVDPSLLKILTL